ncbi:MAG: hypothetical protein HYS98_07735 [Deltaproteobacteria bacterium]|nr:hypothetical protein [Deltaproteobacteria bacterium]
MTRNEYLQIRLSHEDKEQIRKQAHACGKSISEWIRNRLIPEKVLIFHAIIQQLSHAREEEKKFIYANMHDFLRDLKKGELEDVLCAPAEMRLDSITLNLIAAMVETRAKQLKVRVPSWICEIKPLARPYFVTPLESLRLHLLKNAPIEFKARNLFVDATLGERA